MSNTEPKAPIMRAQKLAEIAARCGVTEVPTDAPARSLERAIANLAMDGKLAPAITPTVTITDDDLRRADEVIARLFAHGHIGWPMYRVATELRQTDPEKMVRVAHDELCKQYLSSEWGAGV